MKGNLVKDWMTQNLLTISSNDTMPDEYWKMIKKDVRRLLVVDEGILVGVVTIEDLTQKVPWSTFALSTEVTNDFLDRMPVRLVMSHKLITTTPETTLLDAAKTMIFNDISTLPVMIDDQVVGIITESDIFRACVLLESEE
jgi:acetoin utilization protein AcuB